MLKTINNIKSEEKGIVRGIVYGLIPHIGCIAFIVFTLLGVSAAAAFFRPLLINKWAFPSMVAVSFLLAGFSSSLYLKKNCCANKKRYLSIVFGSVILINLIMFYLVFPALANTNSNAVLSKNSLVKLSFELPCSGHVPLVIDELQKVEGIESVRNTEGYNFEVYYNPSLVNKNQILSQDICKEFNAKEI